MIAVESMLPCYSIRTEQARWRSTQSTRSDKRGAVTRSKLHHLLAYGYGVVFHFLLTFCRLLFESHAQSMGRVASFKMNLELGRIAWNRIARSWVASWLTTG